MRNILIGLIFAKSLFAYTPSVESLLRNSPNKDLGKSSVLAHLKLTKITLPSEQEPVLEENLESSIALRFYNNEGSFQKVLQKDYIGNSISPETLTNVHYIKGFNLKSIGASNIEKDFFYSTISIYLLNDEGLFKEFLKRQNIKLVTNEQIENKKQKRILDNYTKRLAGDDDDKSMLPESLTDDQKAESLEILKESFLKESTSLKRVRESSKFYWIYSEQGLYLKFDGQSHQILEISLETSTGKLIAKSFEYDELPSGIRFPKVIHYKFSDGPQYDVKLKKMIIYDDTGSKFSKAVERSMKELNDSTSNKKVNINPLTI